MALSSSEIQTIHLRKLAKNGKKYYGDNDKIYIGTKEGALRLVEKSNEVIFKPSVIVPETNVQDAIESLAKN